ncbi:hypothetical protein, partial [Polymorphospora rubra]|uniref:hypothetical protein n=1 Tax=Polymorphospora rubra TaxID=338584 RepID=UPI0031CFFF5E
MPAPRPPPTCGTPPAPPRTRPHSPRTAAPRPHRRTRPHPPRTAAPRPHRRTAAPARTAHPCDPRE